MSNCIHGKRSDRCVECGGIGICIHNKRQSYCAKCGGNQVCKHGKTRDYCKECKGSQICEHRKSRRYCKECKGSAICKHNKVRHSCVECGGKNICEHKKVRDICKECGGKNICVHDIQRRRCKICDPLGWAKGCLAVFKTTAKRRGYTPPIITPEEYLRLESKTKRCFGCDGILDKGKTAHLHHDHLTGKVYGFCHQLCNQAEGMFSKMTQRQRENFLTVFFPEVFE